MRESGRTHPVTILFNLSRVFFLVIIPVIRGFISALSGGFARWLSGAWVDILVFFVMIAIAVIAWLCVSYRFDDERVQITSGLLLRSRKIIPRRNITAFRVKKPFFLRPVRAVALSADTLGGKSKRPDFTILLHENQADTLIQGMGLSSADPSDRAYRPSTVLIVALSLLTSGSFAGILFIATFISQSGKLLGNRFSEMMIGTFEDAARTFAFGAPPAAAAIAYILLAGWFMGSVLSFIKYKNLTLTRRAQLLDIESGIFTKRRYFVRLSDINFIDMRQNILTKALKLTNLYLSAIGYGKQKDDISCIIPSGREPSFSRSREKIFPEFEPSPRQHAPGTTGIMRFLSEPVFCILGIAAAIFVFLSLFPSWRSFILFTGLMAFVPALFFLVTRIFDYSTCGIGASDGSYVLRYSTGFTLHTVVIPKDKIVRVELRQSFFQKSGRYCDLVIHSRSEGHAAHCCRSLVKAELKVFFGL